MVATCRILLISIKVLAVFWPALKFIEALIFRMQTTTSDVTVFSHQWQTQFQQGYEGLGILGYILFYSKLLLGQRRGTEYGPRVDPSSGGARFILATTRKSCFRFFDRGMKLSSFLGGMVDR